MLSVPHPVPAAVTPARSPITSVGEVGRPALLLAGLLLLSLGLAARRTTRR
jgi:hypothetical protein